MSTRSDNLMQQIQIQLLKDKLMEERMLSDAARCSGSSATHYRW